MSAWWLFALATILLVAVPFMPRLVRLRIAVLKWLHWNWAARLLERNFDRWVLFFRYIVIAVALAMLYFGWASLASA